jgi:hypothetical protein
MITKEFVTGGKATFTIEVANDFATKNELKPHYTFKVKKKEANGNYPEAYFVSLLTGPDNENSFSYLGVLNPNAGEVRLTAKSRLQDDSMVVKILKRTLARLWANQGEEIAKAGFDVHHEGKCGRCGRKLTVPESVKSGFGPECAGKI